MKKQVGVYQRLSTEGPIDPGALLTDAGTAKTGRGWERVVAVLEREEMVGIYVLRSTPSPARLGLCVVVADTPQVVSVSARGNLRPVVELALEKIKQSGG